MMLFSNRLGIWFTAFLFFCATSLFSQEIDCKLENAKTTSSFHFLHEENYLKSLSKGKDSTYSLCQKNGLFLLNPSDTNLNKCIPIADLISYYSNGSIQIFGKLNNGVIEFYKSNYLDFKKAGYLLSLPKSRYQILIQNNIPYFFRTSVDSSCLYKYLNGKVETFKIPFGTITSIAFLGKDIVLFSKNNKVVAFDLTHKKYNIIYHFDYYVDGICFDNSGRLFVSTFGGIYYLSSLTKFCQISCFIHGPIFAFDNKLAVIMNQEHAIILANISSNIN